MVMRVLISAGQAKVSKPGVDVENAVEADLLLSLQARPVQLILSGRVFVSSGATVTVEYGVTLTAIPIVTFQTSNGNDTRSVLPYNKNGYGGNGPKASIIRGLSNMAVTNHDSDSRWVSYLVIRGTQ